MIDGKVILIVGRKGSGKTTRVKEIIKGVHESRLLLHDVSAQYQDVYKRPLLKFSEFTAACRKVMQGVLVFEEATIFIGHFRNEDILDFLVTARHRKNTCLFVFHSLRDVPLYIWRMADFLFLHKTLDTVENITDRFRNPELVEVFTAVQADPNQYACKALKT